MEEAGPLEAGLLAPHPEDGGDSHDEHHQVLDEEQDEIRATGTVHLRRQQGQRQLRHRTKTVSHFVFCFFFESSTVRIRKTQRVTLISVLHLIWENYIQRETNVALGL